MVLWWTELKRGPWLLAGAVAAVVTWQISTSLQPAGIFLWAEASRGVAYALVLLGPAAAGLGAWAGGRDDVIGLGEVASFGARPGLARHLLLMLAVATPLVIGYMIGAIPVLATVAASPRAWGTPDVALPLLGAVAMVAYIALGYGIGRLGRRWLTAPLVALGVYFGQYIMILLPTPAELFAPFPTSMILPSLLRRPGAAEAGIVWWLALLGLALAALWLLTSLRQSVRHPSAGGLVATLVITGVASVVLARHDQWIVPAEATGSAASACDSAAVPTVCVHPAYADLLPATTAIVRRVLKPLAESGDTITVAQVPGTGVPITDNGVLPFDYAEVDGRLEVGVSLAEALAFGSLVGPCIAEGSRSYAPQEPEGHPVQGVVGLWLMKNAGYERTNQWPLPERMVRAGRDFAALDANVRTAWLAPNLQRLRTCDVRVGDLPRPS
jgi:hypothetical protein